MYHPTMVTEPEQNSTQLQDEGQIPEMDKACGVEHRASSPSPSLSMVGGTPISLGDETGLLPSTPLSSLLPTLFPPLPGKPSTSVPQMCSVQYTTVDQAMACILELQPGTLLAQLDVAHAIRNIPVHPKDRHLLGIIRSWTWHFPLTSGLFPDYSRQLQMCWNGF